MRSSKPRIASSANELTAMLLLEIPKAVKGCRVWRQNVGGAYPIQAIKAVQSLLIKGDAAGALTLLNRTRPLMFGGLPGIPDIDGIMPNGLRCGVEVKFGLDQQSEEQKTCQRIYEERGAIYIIARDVEGCLAELRAKTQP